MSGVVTRSLKRKQRQEQQQPVTKSAKDHDVGHACQIKLVEQPQSVTKRAKAYDVLPAEIWRLIIEMLPVKHWMKLLFFNKKFNRIAKPLSTKCRDLWDKCRYVCVYIIVSININVQLLYITIIIYILHYAKERKMPTHSRFFLLPFD
jgi:hypothetical protein